MIRENKPMDSKPNYFNVSIEDSEILNNCTIKNLVINIAGN